MQENTKKYFKEIVRDIYISLNDIEYVFEDSIKRLRSSKRKLDKFYEKIIK